MVMHKTKACIRPLALSVLSFFLSFVLIQPVALFLDPTFSLLANRGVGKVALTSLAILHILFLLYTQSNSFCSRWLCTNITFLTKKRWIPSFCAHFGLFFMLHWVMLIIAFLSDQLEIQGDWGHLLTPSMFGRLSFGLLVTFFLAWSEELIFRGTLFPYFLQFFRPLSSILLTSTLFMFVHDLSNPLAMVTTEWELGLGLFLLGIILNITYHIAGNLYAGMGIHAGLVFVKVILRRLPIVSYNSNYAWWFATDLREAHIVHLLFALLIVGMIVYYQKQLFPTQQKTA